MTDTIRYGATDQEIFDYCTREVARLFEAAQEAHRRIEEQERKEAAHGDRPGEAVHPHTDG